MAADRAIGILGGTFDPVHLGHLALARQARDELGLERVLFVPNADPPHKQGQPVTDASERETMVSLAIAGEPDFELSRLELEREGPSYAVDTVTEVAGQSRQKGRPEPWFILSVEALVDFRSWREPERILELCRLAVAPRAGISDADRERIEASFPGFEDRFTYLAGPTLDIASTMVRDLVVRGAPIHTLVPPSVAEHIAARGLYSSEAPGPARAARHQDHQRAVDGVDPDVLRMAHLIVEAAEDKKAADIVLLDVRAQTTMTDYFVLCSGASARQLGAIADGITEAARDAGSPPVSREGEASSHWLLIDFGGVIVHVMSAPEREFYQLEQLWSEAALLLHVL